MKLYLAVVLALCATVYCDFGDYEDCCTIEDRREVQRLWNVIWGAKSTTRRITIALETFAGIIKKHPDVAEYIKSKGITADKNDPAAKALSQRVFTDLDTAINLLDDPAILREYLRLIAVRHAKRVGDKAPVLLDYFIEGLSDILGKIGGCHNLDAFRRCFKTINAVSDDVAKDSPPVPVQLPATQPAADASAPAVDASAPAAAAPDAAPSS